LLFPQNKADIEWAIKTQIFNETRKSMAKTMTDEEAWALEEKFAAGNITLSGKPGVLDRDREFLMQELKAAGYDVPDWAPAPAAAAAMEASV